MKKRENQRGYIVLVVVFLVLTLIAAGFFIFLPEKNTQETDNPSPVENLISRTTPTPTPFPFQELTIPYLRGRSYDSSLGEMQRLSENPDYTSYLTSYTSDGLRVNGLLTVPKGSPSASAQGDAGKFPAIIFVHGYIPPEEYQTIENYADYVDYLARNGFVVFKIDLRGHGSSEGEPGGGYYSGDYIIDTLNAHAALQNTDFVNPDAIGLWGHSMSGNVVFRSFVASEEVPAIVVWAGAVYTYEDFSDYRIEDDSYRPPAPDSPRRREREELFETYGSFDPDSEFWRQVPATNYLDGVTGAVQVNHAVNDPVVSIDYSRNLMRILEDTSITHELKSYNSGGHNLVDPAFDQAMQNTVNFFRQHLSN